MGSSELIAVFGDWVYWYMVKVGGAFIQIIISSHDKPSLKIILGFTTKGFRRPEVALANIGFESQPDISLLFLYGG